jgi:hypothetical protein
LLMNNSDGDRSSMFVFFILIQREIHFCDGCRTEIEQSILAQF